VEFTIIIVNDWILFVCTTSPTCDALYCLMYYCICVLASSCSHCYIFFKSQLDMSLFRTIDDPRKMNRLLKQ
jgi:hypothetical protein